MADDQKKDAPTPEATPVKPPLERLNDLFKESVINKPQDERIVIYVEASKIISELTDISITAVNSPQLQAADLKEKKTQSSGIIT